MAKRDLRRKKACLKLKNTETFKSAKFSWCALGFYLSFNRFFVILNWINGLAKLMFHLIDDSYSFSFSCSCNSMQFFLFADVTVQKITTDTNRPMN